MKMLTGKGLKVVWEYVHFHANMIINVALGTNNLLANFEATLVGFWFDQQRK